MVRLSWDCSLLCASALSAARAVKLWLVAFQALIIIIIIIIIIHHPDDVSPEHGGGRGGQLMLHFRPHLLAPGAGLCSQLIIIIITVIIIIIIISLCASWTFLSELFSQVRVSPSPPFCLSMPP